MSSVRLSTPPSVLSKSQTAIIQGVKGVLSINRHVPFHRLTSGRILIKIAYVALSPCDWKMAERFFILGCVDGRDFSGTVHGSNPIDKTTGSFADYVSADAEFAFGVPHGMRTEQAAAVGGTGMGTMGLALKRSLKLQGSPANPVSEKDAKAVLFYAASTSAGTLVT